MRSVHLRLCICLVLKIMVTFWVLNIVRHLVCRGPKSGPPPFVCVQAHHTRVSIDAHFRRFISQCLDLGASFA